MIVHNEQSAFRHFHQDLAGGHQNSEVGHGRLRRESESFGKPFLVLGVNSVKFPLLRAAACPNQAVPNSVKLHAGESLFYDRLLTLIQRFGGHIYGCHTNAWTESLKQSVRKLFFPSKS